MLIKELIEELQKYPGDMPVAVESSRSFAPIEGSRICAIGPSFGSPSKESLVLYAPQIYDGL